MARAKKSSTPSPPQSEADEDRSAGLRIFAKWKADREADNTPEGVDCGPFDIPQEWLAGRTPAEWAAGFKAAEAERKQQRAVFERNIAIRDNLIPPPWMKQVIREAITEDRSKQDAPVPEAQPDESKPRPRVKKVRSAPAFEAALAALRGLFPPDGKASVEELVELGPTELTRKVRNWCKEPKHMRLLTEHKWQLPDRRSVGRAVDKLGRE